MDDIQKKQAPVPIAIDRVGIRSLRIPLTLRDKVKGTQHTVADVEMSVDLPARFKGTHMSRFVESLGGFIGDLNYKDFSNLLEALRERLGAQNAHVRLRFPYFVRRLSPQSRAESFMDYQCSVEGELIGGKTRITLGVEVPVMTVCPCSLAISDQGAHSQRAVVRIRCRFKKFVWLEELLDLAGASGSSPVYALLKREDEKRVTEDAFDNPRFVEDVVRTAAFALRQHPEVRWFRVECESFESIHNHSAFAMIETDAEGNLREEPEGGETDETA